MNETVIETAGDFVVKNYALYQIYWNDNQLPNLYPFAIPYKNESLTVFFENEVIAKLVPACNAEKIGVASHALRQKIGGGVPMRHEFTEQTIEQDFEVLSLCRRSPEEKMLFRLNQWHPGSEAILRKIWEKLGKQQPGEPKNPIYQNHFIAKRQIYQDYVSDFLIPAMNLMTSDEEIAKLCNVDSNYYKLKPPFGEFAQRVKKYTGFDYCTLHAFILERCFSCWINTKPIKVSYI